MRIDIFEYYITLPLKPYKTTYALLLEPVTERPQVFRPKGLACFYGNKGNDKDLPPDGFRNATITII